jgi:integrase
MVATGWTLPARRKYLVPKGLKPVRATLATREKVTYWYHRATGERLKHDPTTAEGFLEIAALDARAMAVAPVAGHKPGSFAALWRAYRGDPKNQAEFPSSPEWLALKPRTKSDYQKVRDWMGEAAEKAIVKTMTSAEILALRDKAARQKGRRFGNYVLQVVRLVLSWGKQRGWLGQWANPAAELQQIRRPKGQRKLNRAWSQAEVAAFVEDAPFHLLVPFCLGLFAGMREGDALIVTRRAYNGLVLSWIASKNDEPCTAPVTGALKAVLDQVMAMRVSALQLALNSRGQPWTESGFRSSFFKRIRALTQAGRLAPGCTFHGLRHTIGTSAREGGESNFRVAAAIGDRTTAMADIYGRDADRLAAQQAVLADVQARFAGIQWQASPPANDGV